MTASAHTIRRASMADLPAIAALGKEKYPGRDIDSGMPWVAERINDPDSIVLIGGNTFGVARLTRGYGFEKRGRLVILAARPAPGAIFEPLTMVRMMVSWSKSQGATLPFRMDADTGVSFKPFSDRLGGREVVTKHYEIPL